MKKLLLSLCLVWFWGATSFASPKEYIKLYFDSNLECFISENDIPPGKPPVKRFSAFNSLSNTLKSETIVSIKSYNANGDLVYQTLTNVAPESTFVINTNNWEKGVYTIHIQTSLGNNKVITITCN